MRVSAAKRGVIIGRKSEEKVFGLYEKDHRADKDLLTTLPDSFSKIDLEMRGHSPPFANHQILSKHRLLGNV